MNPSEMTVALCGASESEHNEHSFCTGRGDAREPVTRVHANDFFQDWKRTGKRPSRLMAPIHQPDTPRVGRGAERPPFAPAGGSPAGIGQSLLAGPLGPTARCAKEEARPSRPHSIMPRGGQAAGSVRVGWLASQCFKGAWVCRAEPSYWARKNGPLQPHCRRGGNAALGGPSAATWRGSETRACMGPSTPAPRGMPRALPSRGRMERGAHRVPTAGSFSWYNSITRRREQSPPAARHLRFFAPFGLAIARPVWRSLPHCTAALAVNGTSVASRRRSPRGGRATPRRGSSAFGAGI